MRGQFKEWRKATFSSPASSFPSGGVEGKGHEEGVEGGKEEEPKVGALEAAMAAAVIEEGVKVRDVSAFSSAVIITLSHCIPPLPPSLPPFLPPFLPKVQATDQRQSLNSVIWRLALPLSLSLGLEPLCSVIDTYYVGAKMGSR